MGRAEDRATRTRQKCVAWLAGLCHGAPCSCMDILATAIREEAEKEQTWGRKPKPPATGPQDAPTPETDCT